LVIAGPIPNSRPLCAVCNGGVHVEVLQVILLVGHNHIDIAGASQAMVGDGKEAVSIWWKIDAYHFRTLVGDDIQKPRILVGETVMVLSPYCSSEENIKR